MRGKTEPPRGTVQGYPVECAPGTLWKVVRKSIRRVVKDKGSQGEKGDVCVHTCVCTCMCTRVYVRV